MEESEIEKIREIVEEFLQKMTVTVFDITATSLPANQGSQKEVIELRMNVENPEVLIGHNGQTLAELERLLRIMVTKKLQKELYILLDINEYKAKKIEYLKNLAITAADQVAKSQQEKVLPPMPSYERRIIHVELAQRKDVVTESCGEGTERSVLIKPSK